MSYTIDQIDTLADFAKEYGVSVATVTNWMDKAGDGKPEPVLVKGRTRFFLKEDLVRLAEVNASGAVMQRVGYVHPDKYAELESRLFELINEKAQLQLEIDSICGAYNDQSSVVERQNTLIIELEKDSEMLTALLGAGVDNWEGYSLAVSILSGENEG